MSDVTSAGRGVRTTARPAARMFLAALMSRSCRVPQAGHGHAGWKGTASASRCPHAEHVLLDGYQRSITTTCRPGAAALYSSIAGRCPTRSR